MMSKFKTSFLLLFAFLFLLPFLLLTILSFASEWPYPHLFPGQLTTEHWLELLSFQSDLYRGLLMSLTISFTVAIVVTSLGFITSHAIAYHKKSSQLLLLAYLPYILSPVVYAACLYYFFVKFGLAGTVHGVILAQLLIAYPFSVIFFSGYWGERIQSMEQLVATLGGNRFQ
ncbi:MAG: ABC transporter permease, partial [Acidobacteria bacterium]